jgi:hypothetical protein
VLDGVGVGLLLPAPFGGGSRAAAAGAANRLVADWASAVVAARPTNSDSETSATKAARAKLRCGQLHVL